MSKETIKGCHFEIKKALGSWQCVYAIFEFILFACNFMLMIKVEGGILLSASYEDEMRREGMGEGERNCFAALL